MDQHKGPKATKTAGGVAALLAPKIEAALALKPRLLTVDQAAVYLARTAHAVRGMLNRGVLQVVRMDGCHVRH